MVTGALTCAGLLKRLHPMTAASAPPPGGAGRNYGAHMAASMALGWLFLGGGTQVQCWLPVQAAMCHRQRCMCD